MYFKENSKWSFLVCGNGEWDAPCFMGNKRYTRSLGKRDDLNAETYNIHRINVGLLNINVS